MDIPIKPILLLADSQLLFWRDGDSLFMERIRRFLTVESPLAAYVGASNGDRPEFFELFRGAMAGIGITQCRHIPAEPSPADLDFFDEAHLILLAGGDVSLGWRAMRRSGLHSKILERYYGGAVLIGLSAGAIQLGHWGLAHPEDGPPELFETLKLVPMVLDAHAEPEWPRLHGALSLAEEPIRGLGIPSGGGALLHPDLTLEAIRHPLVELHRNDDGDIQQSLLFPPPPGGIPEPDETVH